MTDKIPCIKFPPEMSDGQHCFVFAIADLMATPSTLKDLFEPLAESLPGEKFELEILELTREDLETLPDA